MRLIKIFRKKNKLTQNQLADLCNVSLKTVCRWESGLRESRVSDIKKLCEILGVTEAELLNGPVVEEFRVTLKYVKTLEGVDEEMNMNGIALTIAEDGYVGVSGGKKFENYEDIEKVVEIVRKRLTFGFEHRDEMKE